LKVDQETVGVRQTGKVIHTISLVVWHRVAIDRRSEKTKRNRKSKKPKTISRREEGERRERGEREGGRERANKTKVRKEWRMEPGQES